MESLQQSWYVIIFSYRPSNFPHHHPGQDRFRREGSSAQSCTNRTNLRSRISPSGLALTDILLLNTDEGLSELNDLPPLVD